MPRVYLAWPPYAEEYRRRATGLCQAAGCEVVDAIRRDFRRCTEGHESKIVEGVEDIGSYDAVLAAACPSLNRLPRIQLGWESRRSMRALTWFFSPVISTLITCGNVAVERHDKRGP